LEIASGYDTNARPVPPCTTPCISSVSNSYIRFPRIENIVQPASRLVNVSSVVTIMASLQQKYHDYAGLAAVIMRAITEYNLPSSEMLIIYEEEENIYSCLF
jgi:hypothetical protein